MKKRNINILVINAGSSSIKYKLIQIETETVKAWGLVDRIGMEDSMLRYNLSENEAVIIRKKIKDHEEGIKAILEMLIHSEHGAIKDMAEIHAVGHRIVHGGEEFSTAVMVNDKVVHAIEEVIPLAPLHNPHNINGIHACLKLLPYAPMVAVFDTAFHQTMPERAYLYGLPLNDYREYKFRRYGFHGTSHYYLSRRIASVLSKKVEDMKIITCHLGNGSSIAAVNNGKSIDTSMGFTPLEGLMMGTRCGDIDPGIIIQLIEKRGFGAKELNEYLNKKSGVLGLSELSSDFRDLKAAADKGDAKAILARDMFCYRIKKYIGAYIAVLGGVDAIAFSGGIGENDPDVRLMSLDGLESLGIKIDRQANTLCGKEIRLSTQDSNVEAWCIPTNEELIIARQTMELVVKNKKKYLQ